MKLAVLGATGHTGRMTVPALVARGAQVIACGRDSTRLSALAEEHGVETRRVDVTNAGEVRAALRDVDGVANLAGPFLQTGPVPIEAAVRRGIPYADTTGEQAFMLDAHKRYHQRAQDAGSPVINALAYEYALSDLVAHAFFPEGGEALHVLYRARGSGASAGTKKSMARVLGAKCFSFENGKLVQEGYARHTRKFVTDQGPRDAATFPGGEALTIPRHTPFGTVRSYMPAPPSRARLLRALAPVARVALRGPVLRAVERRIDKTHRPPKNDSSRAEIHLVAQKPDRRVLVKMGDPYVVTAELVAEGLTRLVGGKASGVIAPAEALDARGVLEALAKRLPDFRVEG